MASLGWSRATGMSNVGIDYTEIKCWSELTGVKLTPWEYSTIFELSDVHARVINTASDEKASPPPEMRADKTDASAKLQNKIFG